MNDEILKVENLTKTFLVEKSLSKRIQQFFTHEKAEKIYALNNISFSLKNGEILGILGESGSGKYTLARVLMGIFKPDSGSAFLLGKNIFTDNKKERFLIKIQNLLLSLYDVFKNLKP